MKLIGVLTFISLTLFGKAQKTLDYGEVKADVNFKCPETAHWDSAIFGVGNICDSKNELEIRFNTAFSPLMSNLIMITFANGKWSARQFITKQGGSVGNKTECTTILQDPYAKQIYDSVFAALFETLKQNNVFLLPNRNELTKPNATEAVNDGMYYDLTFKVGDKFRAYHFDNPKAYKQSYPDMIEYKNYTSIVDALTNLFVDLKGGYHPAYLK
jgi:hypothetical protein